MRRLPLRFACFFPVFAVLATAFVALSPSEAVAAISAASEPETRGVLERLDLAPPPGELRRHKAKSARAHRARISKAGRRVRALYARAQRARARIPAARRQAYARRELAQMVRKGPVHCLATAIYFEARYESLAGQRAVAEVVMARARTKGRPKSICGVVYEGAWRTTGCQFSFTCDNRTDAARDRALWARTKRVAANALAHGGKKRYAKGALFYHANYVKPRWSKRMVRVARIGTHIFYRPR